MEFYSPWFAIIVLVSLFGLVATPLFKAADSPPSPTANRISTLDGLRGFLALSVFFHHAALYHTYIVDGVWRAPPDRLYGLLGPFGVSIFFMITGFLFWSKIVDKQGRPDWLGLYIGRVFRIAPIYLAAIAVMVACVFLLTGPHLNVSPRTLARELAEWSALGLKSGAAINGFANPGILIANVTWSLRWEWFFYISLAVTGHIARSRIAAWVLPAVGLVASLAALVLQRHPADAPQNAALVALFCVGMLTAASRPLAATIRFTSLWASAAAAILILTVLSFFSSAYAPAPICLLGAAFFLIAHGASLFGLLTTRGARRLGDISFGIYLLQGFALAGIFATLQSRSFALASPLGHWALAAAAGAALVVLATMAHVFIERPGVTAGRSVGIWIRDRASRLRRA